VRKQRLNLLHRQHHRNPLALWSAANLLHPRQFHAQHLSIQKQQCVERLPVGGRCHLFLSGEHGQKTLDFSLPHFARMSKPTMAAGRPQHKCLGPVDISLLGL
jgi:hypothetical protein